LTHPNRVSAFDPELRRLARFLPRGTVGPRTFRLIRRLGASQQRRAKAEVWQTQIGPVRCRVHEPVAQKAPQVPALLWIHGGGYVIGTAAQDDAICASVARILGVVVVAVDYRLAPEHPFPTPLEDCYDALVWTAARDDVDDVRVAIGGASAGGGLAAALAMLARERGEVRPVFQVLSYPMLDDRTAARDDVDDRHAQLWNNRSNRFGWSSYLGRPPGSPAVSGLAAPARHDDLADLPRAWIGVGTADILLEENTIYAERLRAAGVQCQLDIVEGAFHGFDSVCPNAQITARFRANQLEALAAGLNL
jgi:acetyl esterase/lipase